MKKIKIIIEKLVITKPTILYLILSFALASNTQTLAKDAEHNIIDDITVYHAKKIITMDESIPQATAVAVANGRIVAVGSKHTLKPWLRNRTVTHDYTFNKKIIMPGFIEPHVHPLLPAVVTQFPIIAPDDWSLPTGHFQGVTTPQAYKKKLQQLVRAHFKNLNHPVKVPFFVWGYHPQWHGDVYRDQLNQWFGNQPVVLWHRSFHEIIANDAALTLLNITQLEVKGNDSINWQKGHFWEKGLLLALTKMQFLLTPSRFMAGMKNFIAMLHQGGITTVLDMGIGIFAEPETEIKLIRKAMQKFAAPNRLILTPVITGFTSRGISAEKAQQKIEAWTQENDEQVMLDNHFKLMLDGAFFSALSQYNFPGYIDGHHGEWLVPLAETYRWAKHFWQAGYQLHAHTNGDKSAAALIELTRKLQQEYPRTDHRLTLEHFAYATNDQIQQMKALGILVSSNPYYQYILADSYAQTILGEDRARAISPLGSVARAGIPFGLHSDSPMAPLHPLTLADAAINRITINGHQNLETQRISVHQAMRAITIDAAWILRMEDDIGSIRTGKRADFTILEQNPYQVPTTKIKHIKVWGTVFSGKKHPVKH